jgi:hypothetical protein
MLLLTLPLVTELTEHAVLPSLWFSDVLHVGRVEDLMLDAPPLGRQHGQKTMSNRVRSHALPSALPVISLQ